MAKQIDFFPQNEEKKPREKTINKLEKVVGKDIIMTVELRASVEWYEGKIELNAMGYYFKGNDGVMDMQCNMVDLIRNSKYHHIRIEVVD